MPLRRQCGGRKTCSPPIRREHEHALEGQGTRPAPMDDVVPKGEITERLDRTRRRSEKMPRLPMPSDSEPFAEETRAAVRHILETRNSMPPPSSYLTYAGQAGALLSD